MLVLQRRKDGRVTLSLSPAQIQALAAAERGVEIVVTVCGFAAWEGDPRVKLGFEGSREVDILRDEVAERRKTV